MIPLKIYKKYILTEYLKKIINVSVIFFILIFILNIFEEVSFFQNSKSNNFLPLYLAILNTPSIFYTIAPFVILIGTQFFYLKIFENEEINLFKTYGLNNFDIIKITSIFTVILALVTSIIFYNFSAKLKFSYLTIKNKESQDNKYLASVTENGLWIRDEGKIDIKFINANTIQNKKLLDAGIQILDKDFNLKRTILTEEINIEKKLWILKKGMIINFDSDIEEFEELTIQTNLDYEIISNLFSNLSSLTYYQLYDTFNKYNSLGYENNINLKAHIQNLISFPFIVLNLTLLSSILMFNIKKINNKMFTITIGIFFCVLIYYFNYFFGTLGQSEKISLTYSIWVPIIFLFLINLYGLININEKN